MAFRTKTVPLPPLPADETCRWCAKPRRPLAGDLGGPLVCANGCQEHPIYAGRCQHCSLEYHTGNPQHGGLCWQCDRKETESMRLAYRSDKGFRDGMTYAEHVSRERAFGRDYRR